MGERREIRTRTGTVTIAVENSLFLVRPQGYVGRAMLLRGLREATSFGLDQPGGWWHVTDTSGVRLANPVNPFLLRRIRRLPNIRGYVVVAPSKFVWILMRVLGRRLIGADVVVRSEDEARVWIVGQDQINSVQSV